MRKIRYQVATSLDGYIAGPQGEYDWLTMDPQIDFEALFAQFDTFLMGRHTWEIMQGQEMPGMENKHTYVFSRTLDPSKHQEVTVVAGNQEEVLNDLLEKPGKDIWLFGGGELFRSLLEMGFVHTVELAVMPILLGEGIPFLPAPTSTAKLELIGHKVYDSGIVMLEYAIRPRESEQ